MISLEEVTRGKALVRFVELPQALHGEHPCFAPSVLAWERYRVSVRRNPYFEAADATFLLARRAGRPVGRIAAHVPHPGGEGRFGFWSTVEDAGVARELVEGARAWLEEQGCRSMTGPWSFEADDEPGVLVQGFEVPGTTGRPWRPPWEAGLLADVGFEPVADTATWRLPTTEIGPERAPANGDPPGQAGTYADRRLILEGVAAVPDLSGALRASGLRGAWGLARQVREGTWEGCTVVRCEDDPVVAVPARLTAAGRAGYRWVVAPWSPDPDAPPETVHRTYRLTW